MATLDKYKRYWKSTSRGHIKDKMKEDLPYDYGESVDDFKIKFPGLYAKAFGGGGPAPSPLTHAVLVVMEQVIKCRRTEKTYAQPDWGMPMAPMTNLYNQNTSQQCAPRPNNNVGKLMHAIFGPSHDARGWHGQLQPEVAYPQHSAPLALADAQPFLRRMDTGESHASIASSTCSSPAQPSVATPPNTPRPLKDHIVSAEPGSVTHMMAQMQNQIKKVIDDRETIKSSKGRKGPTVAVVAKKQKTKNKDVSEEGSGGEDEGDSSSDEGDVYKETGGKRSKHTSGRKVTAMAVPKGYGAGAKTVPAKRDLVPENGKKPKEPPYPCDKKALVYTGTGAAPPRRFGHSTIYTNTIGHNWRVKRFTGDRHDKPFSMKTIPRESWKSLVAFVSKINA